MHCVLFTKDKISQFEGRFISLLKLHTENFTGNNKKTLKCIKWGQVLAQALDNPKGL